MKMYCLKQQKNLLPTSHILTKNRLKKILDIFNYDYHENLKSTADRLGYFMRPEKADFSKLIRKYLK